MIELGDQSTWPADLARVVDELADMIGGHRDFDPEVPSQELTRLTLDDDVEHERSVRAVIDDVRIAMFHATRLLQRERALVAEHGLRPLAAELRIERLDTARAMFPQLISDDDALLLEGRGPLSWDEHETRLGQIWLLAPFDAVATVGGLHDLFGRWGGESIAWAADQDDDAGERCTAIIDRLSGASVPALVAVAVEAHRLPLWKEIWPTLVAVRLGLADIAGEWYVDDGLPVRVVDVITPGHGAWEERWLVDDL